MRKRRLEEKESTNGLKNKNAAEIDCEDGWVLLNAAMSCDKNDWRRSAAVSRLGPGTTNRVRPAATENGRG